MRNENLRRAAAAFEARAWRRDSRLAGTRFTTTASFLTRENNAERAQRVETCNEFEGGQGPGKPQSLSGGAVQADLVDFERGDAGGKLLEGLPHFAHFKIQTPGCGSSCRALCLPAPYAAPAIKPAIPASPPSPGAPHACRAHACLE